ncbi:site-specific integrase [[Mycobacterium] wendilense]|uniref:Tyrosine-type recombinase/integrase n=1 Tax=[Mycobacterium] wendilense TaxID=3064284 RepID=A0ABM9M9J9_9MYCO|nr:tyrosine-type recombinase/integrase [Mycolicibacterium sp. MU0050]CAJ1579744.1 tyrosine-type recombinase/integrase [Mycolicibacterium sp. MU0050]
MARRPEWVKAVETSAGRRYEVRVHGQRPDGSRFQHKKRFETVEAAVKWRSTVVSELSHGTHVAPSEITVRQAVDSWLIGQRIRPKTMSAYVTSLRPLVDALGDKPVQQVTKDDIEKIVTSLRNGTSRMGTWHAPEKLTKNKKTVRAPWAPASINPMLARARSIFDDLMAQGIVVRNPAALVKSLPTENADMHTLSAEQVTKLLASSKADPFSIAWQLAVYGLRRGEILALDWDSIDFDKGTVSISAARLAVSGGSVTGATKTKTSTRTLPMPEDLARALRAERKRQREAKLALGSKWHDTGLVVVDEFGAAPHPDTLTKAWAKALGSAGLPHVRLHDARHSCATLMHMRGVPVVVIAAWLGHQDAGFTLRTYAHSTNDALADAAAVLNSITTSKPDTAASE